jgi:hypothetical protein
MNPTMHAHGYLIEVRGAYLTRPPWRTPSPNTTSFLPQPDCLERGFKEGVCPAGQNVRPSLRTPLIPLLIKGN